jgi:hypothetical protein
LVELGPEGSFAADCRIALHGNRGGNTDLAGRRLSATSRYHDSASLGRTKLSSKSLMRGLRARLVHPCLMTGRHKPVLRSCPATTISALAAEAAELAGVHKERSGIRVVVYDHSLTRIS